MKRPGAPLSPGRFYLSSHENPSESADQYLRQTSIICAAVEARRSPFVNDRRPLPPLQTSVVVLASSRDCTRKRIILVGPLVWRPATGRAALSGYTSTFPQPDSNDATVRVQTAHTRMNTSRRAGFTKAFPQLLLKSLEILNRPKAQSVGRFP